MSVYVCEVCGYKLDPKSSSVLQYVSGWVRGSGKTVQIFEERTFRYKHDVCIPSSEKAPTLFDMEL